MYKIVRTDKEIDDVVDGAIKQATEFGTKWSGMSYEEGIEATIKWLLGHSDVNPIEN